MKPTPKTRSNFWRGQAAPVFALAPMEDVTDTVFRELIMGVSDPKKLQVLYTEFTNVDGMNHPIGRKRVGERLIVTPSESRKLKETGIKLVAQVWGNNPDIFHRIVKEISQDSNFSGIDINMGCPDKNVVKAGSCSALIEQRELAKEIILATREATHLPLSVKTRTGIRFHDTEKWIGTLLETPLEAIILHGRTQKQMSDNQADWNQVALAVNQRNSMNQDVAILGNGDVLTYSGGIEKIVKHGLDGVMVGRGIFHNPWFFEETAGFKTPQEKIDLMQKHVRSFRAQWEGKKSLYTIQRYLKIYINGFPGAVKLRGQLMRCKSYEEILGITTQ